MPNPSSDRLREINSELSAILEARMAELSSTLRSAEQTTRQIVSTEMEIGRYRQVQSSMEPELLQLQSDLESTRNKADTLRAEHTRLTAARDEARAETARVQQETRELDGEIEKLRTQARALEEEGDVLRRENSDLRGKLRTLDENVARMRKLKEELMLSISGLTQQMSTLSLSTKD